MDSPQILREGFLFKEGRVVKSWKKRWFRLTESSLSYYTSYNSDVIATIPLLGSEIKLGAGERPLQSLKTIYCLSLVRTDRTYFLCCENEIEARSWFGDFQEAIEKVQFLASRLENKAFVENKLPTGWQQLAYMDYSIFLPSQYTLTGLQQGTFKNSDGSLLKMSVASWIPPKLGRFDIEFFRSYAEEKLRSLIQGPCRIVLSSSHAKKHTLLEDVGKWTCWKICATTSDESFGFAVMSRQYLPPLGNGAHIVTLTLKKPDNSGSIMSQFDVMIESIQPTSATYNLTDLQRKLQNLEEDEEFYRWCYSSFHLRPFPRRCLIALQKSLTYLVDYKSNPQEPELPENFFDIIQEMKELARQRDPSKFERQMSIYVSSFLDGGMNEQQTLQWYCEKREILDSEHKQNLDVIMAYLMHIPVDDSYLIIQGATPDLISSLSLSSYLNLFSTSRLLVTDYFRKSSNDEVYCSLVSYFLRTNHSILHLSIAETVNRFMNEHSFVQNVIDSNILSIMMARLVETLPSKTPLEYDNYPDESNQSTITMEKKLTLPVDSPSGSPFLQAQRRLTDVRSKLTGYIQMKTITGTRNIWAVADNDTLKIFDKAEETEPKSSILLRNCTRIELNEGQAELVIHTTTDCIALVMNDHNSALEWGSRIQNSSNYTGKKVSILGQMEDLSLRSNQERSSSFAFTTGNQPSPRGNMMKTSASSPRRSARLSYSSPSELRYRRGPVVRWRRPIRADLNEEVHKRVIHQVTFIHFGRVILQLAKLTSSSRSKIMEDEAFLKALPYYISSKDPRVIELSISLVLALSDEGELFRKALVAAGTLPALLALSGEIDFHIPENTDICTLLLRTLNNFAKDDSSRRILMNTHIRDTSEDIYRAIQTPSIKQEASILYLAIREEKPSPSQ